MFRSLARRLGAALLVLAILSGCSAPALPSVPNLPTLPSAADAQEVVCDSLAALTSGVERLANVEAGTTVADLKALKAPIDTAVAAIKAANQVLNQASIAELTTSYDNLSVTINQLPENAAVGETATRVRAGAAAVRDALGQTRTALTCP